MKYLFPLISLLTVFLWACGSGSSPSSANPAISSESSPSSTNPVSPAGNTSTPSGTVAVSISPPTASLLTQGTQQFVASVQNTSNTALTWTVDGIANGNSSVGMIAGTGTSVTYIAPAAAGSHTVTATSVADSTQSASATVTVTAAISVSISPSTASILTNSTQQFTATVQNTPNTDVTWTVDGISNGNSSTGTITGTGMTVTYTAPSSAGSHTVTVTSLADASKFASAAVTVSLAPVVRISISPPAVSLATNAVQQFTATVQNTSNTDVTWTVDGVSNGNSSTGTISGAGATITYTAPASSGSHTVTATSVADSSKSASASVTVRVASNTFPSSNHVFVVMLENQSFSQVFPSGSASNCSSAGMPHLCSLAAANGMALNFYSNQHASLMAYLFNTSGAAWANPPYSCSNGMTCSSIGVIDGDNLPRALAAAGKTWRGYFESMPKQGYMGGDTGGYTVHHNPFIWYSDVANSVEEQDNMYPFTQFATDVGANTFQNFSYIIPNISDDAEGTGSQSGAALLLTADNWLQTNVFVPLLATPFFQPDGDGILIVTFDEGAVAGKSGDSSTDNACSPTTSGCGGHIAFVMIGPQVTPASTTNQTYHFQDMLHTIIHLLGMTDYMNGAATGSDIALLPGA